jgi:hypothetical protein
MAKRGTQADYFQLRKIVLENRTKLVRDIVQIPEARLLLERLCPIPDAAERWYRNAIRTILREEVGPDGVRRFTAVEQLTMDLDPEPVDPEVPVSLEDEEIRGEGEEDAEDENTEGRVYVRPSEIVGNAAAYRSSLRQLLKQLRGTIERHALLSSSAKIQMIQGIADVVEEEYRRLTGTDGGGGAPQKK